MTQLDEVRAETAELIADEMVWLIGVIGYAEVEVVKSWCHLWAEQFRSGSQIAPDVSRIEGIEDIH